MRSLLTYRNGTWTLDNQRILTGRKVPLEDGSRLILNRSNDEGADWRVMIERDGRVRYDRLVGKVRHILLLPQAAIKLGDARGETRVLAERVVERTCHAWAEPLFPEVVVVRPGYHKDFTTANPLQFSLTNGTIVSRGFGGGYQQWRYTNGTYLIRSRRHPTGGIDRLQVIANRGWGEEVLEALAALPQ